MNLAWKPDLSTTSLWAAYSLARRRPVVDPAISTEMQAPAAELDAYLKASNLSADEWPHLLGFAHDFDIGEALAKRILSRAGLDTAFDEPLTGHLRAVGIAGRRAFPNFMDQAQHRIAPLKQQWEARGPGLIHQMRQTTSPQLFVEFATVVLTAPVQGGGGMAYLEGNRVILEAVLTNANDRLPEVLRLAWMLSQLNLDLPMFCEEIPLHRRIVVSQVAMLPAALAAAQQVELAAWSEDTLRLAMELWDIPVAATDATVDAIYSWWETYQEQRPSFETALPALNLLLPD